MKNKLGAEFFLVIFWVFTLMNVKIAALLEITPCVRYLHLHNFFNTVHVILFSANSLNISVMFKCLIWITSCRKLTRAR